MTPWHVSKYRVRSPRTSSASRFSDREGKPTRSANRTDTSRRCADAGSGTCCAEPWAERAGCGAQPGWPTCVPHSSQNLASGRSGVEQLAQVRAKAAPHSEQNLLPARLSAPQLGQAKFLLRLRRHAQVRLRRLVSGE